MSETPAEARLRRKIEGSWPGHGPCGWLVYSPEREHPSAIYDLEVTATAIAQHHGLECVAVVPTLTDSERYAVTAGLRALSRAMYADPENLGGEYRDMQRDAATLRRLLERTK